MHIKEKMKKLLLVILCSILCLTASSAKKKQVHTAKTRTSNTAKRNEALESLGRPANLADSIIIESVHHLGKPYRKGNKGPNAFDCSGFTGYVYSRFGFALGASSRDQYLQGVNIPTEHAHKGDLVFFSGRDARKGIGHVGIVYDVDTKNHTFRFIHAASNGISIDKYPDAFYYSKRYRGIRRIACYEEKKDNTTVSLVETQPQMLSTQYSKTEPRKETIVRKHTVSKGETLGTIANKYKCKTSDLRKWNKLPQDAKLKPGQTLDVRLEVEIKSVQIGNTEESKQGGAKVILTESNTVRGSDEENGTHIVKAGEKLADIASKYGCSEEELLTWNHLRSRSIREKTILKVRKGEIKADEAIALSTASYDDEGETAEDLPTQEQLSTGEEAAVYALVNESFREIKDEMGDKDAENIKYTVKGGDTFRAIANRYGCTTGDIMRWNNLKSYKLKPGMTLIIKKKSAGVIKKDEIKATSTSKTDNHDNKQETIHIVKKGDDLHQISKKYGCSTEDLMKWNNLTDNRLSIGQKIKIKAETASEENGESVNETENRIEYTVKKNDNLYNIGKRYNVSSQQIMEWNKLKSNRLSLGQVLIIYTTQQ